MCAALTSLLGRRVRRARSAFVVEHGEQRIAELLHLARGQRERHGEKRLIAGDLGAIEPRVKEWAASGGESEDEW